jgi:MFS family permease
MFLGGSLCFLYFMQNLGFNNNLLGGMIAINGIGLVGTLVGARRVGRMVDRFGVKRMLMFGHFFWSLLPAIWLLATPRTATLWVGVASLVGGVFPAAANIAGIKLVTRFRPPEESSMYIAVSTTVGSVAGGFGSIVAGAFVSAMGARSFTVLGLVVSAFPILFLASTALRLTTAFLIIPRIRVMGRPAEENRPFLLPLFFEAVPGISRIMRKMPQPRQSRQGMPPGVAAEREGVAGRMPPGVAAEREGVAGRMPPGVAGRMPPGVAGRMPPGVAGAKRKTKRRKRPAG